METEKDYRLLVVLSPELHRRLRAEVARRTTVARKASLTSVIRELIAELPSASYEADMLTLQEGARLAIQDAVRKATLKGIAELPESDRVSIQNDK